MRIIVFLFLLVFLSCKEHKKSFEDSFSWNSAMVTATAYNSLAYQTNSNPHITAFGDSLFPGLKYIAVSRDLLKRGLKHNIPVKIEGLEGIYIVKDKMHSRWKNRIDIYMGLNVEAAKEWGRKRVCIDYGIPIKHK
ncbi:3D (Asp-Asp-Asp) domain-containing protein [Flaviramulus basaltis]|uniref:3D (Asp-Asp-Asp) domain-containing protein n=1 Tax=Flaviramulus basaltis TaxID=369401 RepID=A0A1K2IIQ8_9FLAO|nr:3D domain-containing protein [Flaviramulus basaltis]SFZ91547.1 3D (Asp-Asp-Asp) domain-containing protein [Flaviramulus basaltis]